MVKDLRRVHAPAFKAKVALEAIKEQRTIAELSSLYGVHSTQITKWKRQALDILSAGFSEKQKQKGHDERGLIHTVLKRKISYGSKSQKGADTMAILCSTLLSAWWNKPKNFFVAYNQMLSA